METTDELRLVKDLLQAIPRARRTLRTYPEGNPVYVRTVGDVFGRFRELFALRDEIILRVNRNEILFDSKEVARSGGEELDLPLLFFRDGIRELRFRSGLTTAELEEFLKIIAADLSSDDPDDDLVTLLWERDFVNIRYFVDESFLMEEGDYESEAIERVKTKMPGVEQVLKSRAGTLEYADVAAIPAVHIEEEDLRALLSEVERSCTAGSVLKLAEILLETIRHRQDPGNFDDLRTFFSDLLIFTLRQGDFRTFVDVGTMVRRACDEPGGSETLRSACAVLSGVVGSPEIIAQTAHILDTAKDLDKDLLSGYVALLSPGAIGPLVAVLGALVSIQGRKRVILALSSLGRTDLQAFAPSLQDPRWYVVRNVVHIFRQIGSPLAEQYIVQTLRHEDPRVRREAIRALGELKIPSTLGVLKGCLNDQDATNRAHAARAIGDIGSEAARELLLQEIGARSFEERDFGERKEFFHALSRWRHPHVLEAMIRILRERSIFRRGRSEESKALAAYALGLMGQREALPLLQELRGSASRLLREHAENAIRTIEHGS